MRWQTPLAAAVAVTALTTSLTASAAPASTDLPGRFGGRCSADARLVGFSDSLDKTVFGGLPVAGLSALAVTRPGRGLALVDNIQSTPARVFDLRIDSWFGRPRVAVDGVTVLRRPDGTAYTGADFDGEGLVAELGGRTILATSEREPSIRRFRLSDGKEQASLPVPARFQVAPAGEAAVNQTFEAFAASPDGRTLYAGMEGPLSADGADASGRSRNRILEYTALRGHGDRSGTQYKVSGQLAYKADAGLGLVELAVAGRDQLVSLERGFTPGVGNTVRVYKVSTHRAVDVSNQASLATVSDEVFLTKELLVDLVDCPPSGAVAKQPQPNPLLDNVEALALGTPLPGGRRQLYLLSDDNGGATQITRFYSLAVDLD